MSTGSRNSDRPSRRGPRPRFTRAEVLRTALRLIDSGEPGAFSMRQLADEMGMGVMTLYGYVRDKQELYEAVTALAFEEIPARPTTNGPWHERVGDAVRELHAICQHHPNLLTIALTDDKLKPGLFQRRELILTALRDAGFSSENALHVLGVLTSYAIGFAVAQESPALRQLPLEIRHKRAEGFPGLSADAANYAAHLDPAAFEYGLSLIIRGLRADL
ncbi:TetR/AcrR family transcriptional regulator [Mycobacterium talmoniae]|uniref:TetR/AcrR family transcriptional regulator n=1 Tax=Mycobacterium talmoniae TaxID=1858794 RepID=UPI001F6185CB|nr:MULTISPECIES: TetR/AcrR family transcriptional regulator C-terminal domain-containing protein [Mycobacterium]